MSAAVCLRVARSMDGLPLWIEPHALKAMLDSVGPRLGLERRAGEDDDGPSFAELKRAAERKRLAALIDGAETVQVGDGLCEYTLTPDGIAVVPILGPLVNRYDWFVAACGWISYDALSATMREVTADQRVRAVLLDIDSPGGEAAGTLDAADAIRTAAGAKTVWAVANTLAASAAFGLGAAASRLTVPRVATVGSVGVVGIHLDQSAFDAEMGLKYTPIFSGRRKIDGWGHAALSDEAMETFQAAFDESRRKFAEAVAGFRGMATEAVLATEAGVFDDDAAVKVGFADAVSSFDETLAELGDALRGTPPRLGGPAARSATAGKEAAMANTTKPARAAETEKPEDDEDDEKAKAAPATAAENGDDEGDEDDDEPMDAAAVVDLCVASGCPGMATGLIREKANAAQVKAKLDSTGAIRQLAKDCTKLNPGLKAKLNEMAETAIAAGVGLEAAREKMWGALLAAQGPDIVTAASPDATAGNAAAHGWNKVVAKVNARIH